MKQFVRGTSVHVSITFRDHEGAPITPPAADVTLSYVPVSGGPGRSFLTYPLAANLPASDWVYDWDSSVATAGVVYGTAVATTGLTSKVDFEFRLTANRSNKELAGDDYWQSSGY